jgi:hypothetical protein
MAFTIEEQSDMDIVWLVAGSAFFIGSCGLVCLLDRLRGED